jgi:hypothetical protein
MPTIPSPTELDTAAVRAGGIPTSPEGRMEWAVAGIDVRMRAGYGYQKALTLSAAKFHLDTEALEDEYLRRRVTE